MRSSLMRTDEVPPVNWDTAKHGARRSGKTVKSQRRISEKLEKFISYKNKKQKSKLKFFSNLAKRRGKIVKIKRRKTNRLKKVRQLKILKSREDSILHFLTLIFFSSCFAITITIILA